jgi:hypothetical protein
MLFWSLAYELRVDIEEVLDWPLSKVHAWAVFFEARKRRLEEKD